MKGMFKILLLVLAVGVFGCSEDKPSNGGDGGQDGDGGGGTDGDCLDGSERLGRSPEQIVAELAYLRGDLRGEFAPNICLGGGEREFLDRFGRLRESG